MEQFLINLIRRWFWLLGLATLIAGATTYWVSAQQPTIYDGKARLIVGPGVDSLNPDLDALRAGGKLLQTYAELATTRPVLQAVIDDHELDIDPDMLKEQIRVTSNEETQILTIRVQDEDPTQAAAIANTVADTLVRISPFGADGPEIQLNDQMRGQAADLEESIAGTEARIKQLETDLIAATSAETQPLLTGKTAQEGGGGTGARIKQLEADLQAAANLNKQHLISNDSLSESIASTEARIKQLEADLIAPGLDTQLLILDQIARERDHLSELERADLERQSWMLDQILQGSIASTQSRITQLESDFETAVNVEMQRLLSDQIAIERNYLSELRQADVEGQRRMLEQSLQDSVASAEARITQLGVDLQATTDAEMQREVLGQITQERQRLSDAERANLEIQRQTIDQLLQLTMSSIEAMIARLQTNLPVVTTELEAQQITNQISQERTRLSEDRRTLANLYASLKQSLTNQVRIVEPAIAGVRADTQLKLNVLIGAMAGLVLSLALVLAFEYLDASVKTVEDLGQVTDVPILGAIAKHKALKKGVGRERLAVWAWPDSRAAEGYRALSTKLVLSKNDDSPRSLLIISPDIDHDVGEVAANLAITMAQTGTQVVLVDANLRRPTVGQLFGLNDRRGLADALTDPSQQPELASIGVANLSVLPSGTASANPFDQIASPHMASLITQLTYQSDVVIIVAPTPTLFGETMFLASLVNGVVLAVRRGATRREVIGDVIDNLRSVGARVVGVVLDNNRRRSKRVTSRPVAVTSSATDDSLEDKKRSFIGLRNWRKRKTSVQAAHQTRPGLGD